MDSSEKQEQGQEQHQHQHQQEEEIAERLDSSSSESGHDDLGGFTHIGGANGPRAGLRRHDSLAIMEPGEQQELERLATSLSRVRTGTEEGAGPDQVPSVSPEDPALDPTGPSFDIVKWLQHMVGIHRKQGIEPVASGVSLRNLKVTGTGSAVQFQDTISDTLLAPLRPGQYFSLGKKKPKTILHRFDGLVNAGELLIVLGRPGSGCSTLLKTVTGQLHGLNIDKESIIHYNGVPQEQMRKEFKGEAIYNQEVSTAHRLEPRRHPSLHLY